ncbi:Lrp/AsnC ligand binding domain-containing protein [Actinotalea sp.]|uniref:Lrp/AsnC family transcriptional regulator n=1 Tax=Actinotalea sp. TaxID=1872145 RepID=UPI002CF600FF|nr:Lrp/AsnC ligand binding domain-containing protein [Actinotalea sp.]HQY34332.1 Lrp/AsnC ligand binding domain-containing protein [Actinotalea sp.]HRA51260.1 Lrp/AsnC ligand binding domain-containing protein [Actinotalea sp.]
MITAIVHIDADPSRIPEIAAQVAEIAGVREVFSVTGGTDLIAMVKVREHEQLADVIADRVSKVDGIIRTQTFIAFRAYSSSDLDAAFDLGLGD